MRVLLLFRGAPGCGKSTYIHENGLDSYTLSADTIRMQYSSPIQTKNGSVQISAKNDSVCSQAALPSSTRPIPRQRK